MIRRWGSVGAVVALLAVLAPPALADETPPPEVVDLGGEPVTGSPNPTSPEPLDAGLWSDTLGPAKPPIPLYYSYSRTMEDSTVHVGVVGANTEANDAVSLVVTTAAGEECGSDESPSGFTNGFGTFGVGLAVGDAEDSGDPCLGAEELLIAVGRGSSSATNDLTVAIRIVEEALPTGIADLPTAPPTPQVPQPDVPTAEATVGATSFADAPYLEPGAYPTSVAEGDERLWRVRLDWGQQLSVRVEIAPGVGAEIPDDLSVNTPVELVMHDPMLDSVRDGVEEADGSGYYSQEADVLVEGTPPVGYRNRFDDEPASLPGDYWVTLSVEAPDDREPLDVPMTLAVDVVETDQGSPEFPDTVRNAVGGAGPEGYDPATPYLVGEGQWSADVSGTPRVPGDDASGGPQTRTLVGIALAVVSAGLCLAGVASLRRRSRQ